MVSGAYHNDLILTCYEMIHQDNSCYSVSPFKMITVLILSPNLYIISPWLIYSILLTGNLWLLIPFIYFAHFNSPLLLQPQCSLNLWIGFVLYFSFHIWDHAVFVSLYDLFHLVWLLSLSMWSQMTRFHSFILAE